MLDMWHLNRTTPTAICILYLNNLMFTTFLPLLMFIEQVFDDVAVELTMALLQFFSVKPAEDHLYRTLKALSKFVTVCVQL